MRRRDRSRHLCREAGQEPGAVGFRATHARYQWKALRTGGQAPRHAPRTTRSRRHRPKATLFLTQMRTSRPCGWSIYDSAIQPETCGGKLVVTNGDRYVIHSPSPRCLPRSGLWAAEVIGSCTGEPVALGGMWEAWWSDGETLRTFATLTTKANPTLALIQDRMPVIIERADWPRWFGEMDGDAAAMRRPLPASQHASGRSSGRSNTLETMGRNCLCLQPPGWATRPALD
jgi:hypothetical protein